MKSTPYPATFLARPSPKAAFLLCAGLIASACGGSLLQKFGIRIESGRIAFDEHINFASDSDEILAESHELLDALAQTIKDHPEITHLRVDGHTDSTGDDAHNLELSERRAAAVAVALRERGVTIPIDSRGFGESAPLCSEDTPECHAANRRVELVIL